MIFIIELFKFSNENSHKIKKLNPNSFACLSTELLGYNILWNAFRFTQDDKAALNICDFLAEIYSSYE